MDIAFVKYKEFKELRDINEAKIKIQIFLLQQSQVILQRKLIFLKKAEDYCNNPPHKILFKLY